MKMMFTSGRKYTKLHSGVLRYADFKKIGKPRDWTKGSHSKFGLKLGYACVFLFNYIYDKIF